MLDPARSQFFPPDSLYISQKDCALQRQPLRDSLSGKHDHFLSFVVEQQKHFASVRVHINAFQLDNYPGQRFYAAVAHYRLCCRDAKVQDFRERLCATAQKVYASSFRYQDWNFNSDHCWCVLYAHAPMV